LPKRALITGVNGMVGSHMADFLLEKGYEVYGTTRDLLKNNTNTNIKLLQADINDQISLHKAILEANPNEIYNFGGVSFSPNSWMTPEYTANVNGIGALRILECIKQIDPSIRYYQAGSSEIYGNLHNLTITEETIPHPKTPYGVAKLYAQWIIRNYRESYDLFACNGITFNHESERRNLQFVTRKITNGVARIAKGEIDTIELGNLDITRDWGYAPDFVEAMWLMLQNKTPEDFIIATNQSHSLRYLLEIAFEAVGIIDYSSYITINPKFVRNNDIQGLKGDYSKINNHLGWSPKTSFEEMITKMVKYDLNK
jgi:GDPmannose 4,6-dehydratase